MHNIEKNKMPIIELGIASQLTQGAERGWFEYGRPGHPKNGSRHQYANKNSDAHTFNTKKDE